MPEPVEPLESSEPPAARPSRAITFLGRITQALREQNWAAVVIEIGIVVIGVVIGFQVTAWGQARSDVATEQTYLRQLHADLVSSEEGIAEIIQLHNRRAFCAAGIAHAFWQDDRPPQDSLVTWIGLPLSHRRYRPILGTAKAIVSTGDLRLVSDDSLRAELVQYIESAEEQLEDVRRYEETYYRPGVAALRQEIDPEALRVMRDSSRIRAGGLRGIPDIRDKVPFPVDINSILTNRQVYNAYQSLLIAHRNSTFRYLTMLEDTQVLRARVERALEE